MAKLFGNLHLVLVIGLVLAVIVIATFAGYTGTSSADVTNDVMHWLHLFFGVMWIGLLYYFNFVQTPTMPKVPAELKKGVTGYIAPSALFWFRWGAMGTIITGLAIAFQNHFAIPALTFQGTGADGINMIGLGMWIAIIMFLNVWLVIWPNQKKILGLVEATDEQKAKATPIAGIASRLNTLLSLPMFYCMINANIS